MEVNASPVFSEPVQIEFRNYLTGQMMSLNSADFLFECSEENIRQIAAICSQKNIYDRLFKPRLNGQPYTLESARDLIRWARKGWLEKTHFVFLVKDIKDEIVGCLDIKSPDLNEAPIGYWASEHARGFMTNAVLALCKVARNAGYRSLYALAAPDNQKSIGVLRRAGFQEKGMVNNKDGKERVKYKILLGR